MTNWTTLPHQNLIAYQVARELVVIIREAKIADAKLRDQALRAATSACLNIAEAGGHLHENDKRERATRTRMVFVLVFVGRR
jgi:four helix bundle protein